MNRSTHGRSRPGRGARWALMWAAVVLVIGLVGTAVAASMLRSSIRGRAEESFDTSAAQTRLAIESEVQRYFEELRDVGASLTSFETEEPEAFGRYVNATGVFEQLESVAGIIVLQQVPDGELDAFAERIQRYRPGFVLNVIGEVPEGSPHYILTHYVPGELDLELPIGTDVSPVAVLQEALLEGTRTGAGAAGSFQDDPLLAPLARATGYEPVERLLSVDFFIGVPVAGVPGSGESPAWVIAPVDNFDEVLAQALEGQPDELGISLTVDLKTPAEATDAIEAVAEREGTVGPREDAAFEVEEEFNVDGVNWTLAAWSTPGADSEGMELYGIALMAGAAGSLLLAGLVYLRIRGRERDRAYVAELADREQLQREILESVDEAVVLVDEGGRIVHTNPVWDQLRRDSDPSEVSPGGGERYSDVICAISPAGGSVVADAMERALVPPREPAEVDLPIDDPRGVRRWKAVRIAPLGGRGGGVVAVHSDITGRKRSEAELERKASRDILTGLLNRRAFEEELDRAVALAGDDGTPTAVLFIDLDGFKPINDTHGHAVGDEVLRAVAKRISAAVRTTDRVGRLGGDEFVVLVGSLHDPGEAGGTAERILESLTAPVTAGRIEIPIAASVGVATSEADGCSAAGLLQRADQAMYEAKQAGGARWAWARPAAPQPNP